VAPFFRRLSTDVHRNSAERVARMGGERRAVRLDVIALPSSYDERTASLRTGDLVFIRKRGGTISHVVIWVGPIGRAPDGIPRVIDSHGQDVRDCDGRPIPCGVQLRPFREDSRYNRRASHALRIVAD
jgi:hypothetical protein